MQENVLETTDTSYREKEKRTLGSCFGFFPTIDEPSQLEGGRDCIR